MRNRPGPPMTCADLLIPTYLVFIILFRRFPNFFKSSYVVL